MDAPKALHRLAPALGASLLVWSSTAAAQPLEAPPAEAPPAPEAPPAEAPPAPEAAPEQPPAEQPPAEPPPAEQPPPEQPPAPEEAPSQPEAAPAEADAAEPPPPPPVEEVTVVGAPVSRIPGSAHVVSSRTLQRYHYDDPHAAMQLVPGVYVRQEDGVGLRPNIGIRGAIADRSKKVALMEDGVPVAPAPYSAPAAYYFPVFTRAYSLRVLKGPAALVYGPQTIGGAVDVITRPIPGTASGAVDLGAGDFGYLKLHGYFGSSDERTGFLVEGVHLSTDGFKELPSGADTGFYRNEWMFKGAYTLDPTSERANEVGVKLTYSDEVSNETYLGLTDADFRKNPLARYGASALDRMRWFRTGLAAFYEVEPARNIKITTTLYRNDFWRRWRKVNGFQGADLVDVLRNPDSAENVPYHEILTGQADAEPNQAILIGPNERSFVSQGLMTKLEMKLETGPVKQRIEYGFKLHNDRIERRHSQDAFLYVGGQLVPTSRPTEVTAFNEASTDAFSFYVVDAATLGPFTLTPGVRLELMRSVFENRATGAKTGGATQIVLPGVGAYLGVTKELGVLAGVYRGMSPPPPEQDIDPEVSVNYEAGARFTSGPARAEVIGYYNAYSNLTDICTFSSGCLDENLDRQFSAGRARIYGLEAFAEHEPAIGALKFPLRVAYTLTFTEFLETFQSQDPIFGNVEEGDEMPYVPRHQGFASAGVEVGPMGGFVSANYVAPMREEAGSEPLDDALTTDEQFLVDVGLHFQALEWLRLYGTVRNLFDELYIVSRRPYGARPNAPRWAQVGVKAEF